MDVIGHEYIGVEVDFVHLAGVVEGVEQDALDDVALEDVGVSGGGGGGEEVRCCGSKSGRQRVVMAVASSQIAGLRFASPLWGWSGKSDRGEQERQRVGKSLGEYG